MVASEYEKCVHFKDGLRDSLKVLIAPQREQKFDVLLNKTKIAEEVKRVECQNKDRERGKNKTDLQPSSSAQRPKKRARPDGPYRLGVPVAPTGVQPYSDCGRRHPGNLQTEAGQCDESSTRVVQQPPRGRGLARCGNGLGKGQRALGRGAILTEASLDCATKGVVLRTEDDVEVVVIGEHRDYLSNVISVLVAKKLVRKKCEAYLACVSVSTFGDFSVKNIRTVREFFDVFLEELSSLPPNREVEFGIKLLSGTCPVFIAHYQMAPNELTELKAQLQELLDRGFIRSSYYRRFIEGFSLIVAPLTKFLSKNVPFVWTDEQQSSFKKLESIFTQTHVLIQPESSKKFVVYSDSRMSLKSDKGNYPMHDLELAAVVFILKVWRHYLYGERYIIYTDHKSFKYLLTQKDLNLRQRRCIELIKDYDCTIESQPGKANLVVDALSCRAMSDLKAMFAHLSLFEEGEAHSSPYTIHSGRNKMYRDLRKLYWWSSLKQEERITMDFISGLPLTPTQKHSVWVIVDRLTKFAHFILVRTNSSLQKLVKLYISVILELPPDLDRIHDVFYVSMLRRYWSDPSHVVFVEEIEVRPSLTFEEEQVQILDRDVKVLRRKPILLVKLLWWNHSTKKATWEPENSIRQQYPHLFGPSKF
ncbi:uncharacterized protein LOC128035438 [Gossypium raimondii]|uniref:uncharacterized protein LOC128035438 n=1 Tax=Gossypium raimondii TaxID=29730 RepID=UPI00227A1D30|nr:uncharacterized protein LOC128035438 [Gossypium raimondii]